MFVRAYLRASTQDQDANRARQPLQQFCQERGLNVAAWYCENESGAKLKRPELFRLLDDCQPGDMLLVEQVDRLSRLNDADWQTLRREIRVRDVRIVALDLPTSWGAAGKLDEMTERMLGAVNEMLLDMLAAIARKDYTDRQRRQKQGIHKITKGDDKTLAKQKYPGRKPDAERNAAIMTLLRSGKPWSEIQAAMKCSRATISRLRNKMPEAKGQGEASLSQVT